MNTMPRRSPIRNYFDASHGGSNKGTPKEKIAETLENIFEEYTGHSPPSRGTVSPSSHRSRESRRKYVERDAEILDVSDIERVWRTTKKQLRSREEDVKTLRARVSEMERSLESADSDRAMLRRLQEQNESMKTRSKFLETQLSEVRKEAKKWTRKYESMETSMNDLKGSVEEETAARVLSLERAAAFHEATALRLKRANREIELKYGRLKAKYAKLKSREKSIEKCLKKNTRAVIHVKEQDVQLRSNIVQLQIDNRRLVQILCTCKEYDEYCDSFRASPVSYLSPTSLGASLSTSAKTSKKSMTTTKKTRSSSPKHAKKNTTDRKISREGGPWVHFGALKKIYANNDGDDNDEVVGRSNQKVRSPKREIDLWIPQSVLQLTRDFHRRHLQHISPGLIHTFLRQINMACRARSKKRAAFVAKKYNGQIENLRRQLQQRRPYKEVILEDRVSGLSHQLNQYVHDATIRAHRSDEEFTSRGQSGGVFSSSLAMAENLAREVEDLRDENESLKRRLGSRRRTKGSTLKASARSSTSGGGGTHEYIEGAAWVARNAEYMTNEVVERVSELQERFRAQSESITDGRDDRSRQAKVLERWAEQTNADLRVSPEGSSRRGVRRLRRLLLDRTSYELASLQRRFRKICKAAAGAWDDRAKRKIFLRSLPLEAPFLPSAEADEDEAEAASAASSSAEEEFDLPVVSTSDGEEEEDGITDDESSLPSYKRRPRGGTSE